MNRRPLTMALAVVLLAAAGVGVYLYLAGGSGEPSTELTTPSLATESTGGSAITGMSSFVIDPGASSASFEIDEVLRGSPNTVVGSTSEVAGQFRLDLDDMRSIEFSQMLVNARTFTTDSALRDRAIRGPIILNSATDELEFITLDVTSVDGLSGRASPGDTYDFTVSGALTIKGTTAPATFEVTATMVDASTISGTAETMVLREDYGIGIPNAPGVAGVNDEVIIRLDFVAVAG